jgi:GNAT superfamily N-acetyltransferase
VNKTEPYISDIISCLRHISPQAAAFAQSAIAENHFGILHINCTPRRGCLLLKVWDGDLLIYFAYAANPAEEQVVAEIVLPHLTAEIQRHTGELCCNVYGQNRKLISTIRKRGFINDFDGYHMEYNEPRLPSCKTTLCKKPYDKTMLGECTTLFDEAYNPLTQAEGKKPDFYARNNQWFASYLLNLGNAMQTFWKNDELVGAYIIQGDYLRDVVITPTLQGQGYGSEIIACAMQAIRSGNTQDSIRLRVARLNRGARTLYHRLGFHEIASCAEHT